MVGGTINLDWKLNETRVSWLLLTCNWLLVCVWRECKSVAVQLKVKNWNMSFIYLEKWKLWELKTHFLFIYKFSLIHKQAGLVPMWHTSEPPVVLGVARGKGGKPESLWVWGLGLVYFSLYRGRQELQLRASPINHYTQSHRNGFKRAEISIRF